jgi:hypothetical protein
MSKKLVGKDTFFLGQWRGEVWGSEEMEFFSRRLVLSSHIVVLFRTIKDYLVQ